MENKFEFGDEVILTSKEKYRVVQIVKDSKGISYKLQSESGVCRYVNEDSLELYSETPKFEVSKWYKAILSNSDFYLKYVRTEKMGGGYNRIWGEIIHPLNVPIYRKNDYLANSNIEEKLTLLTDLSEIQQYLPDGHCDKAFVFKEGEYYTSIHNGDVWQVFVFSKMSTRLSYYFETKSYINVSVKVYLTSNNSGLVKDGKIVHYRLSTPEEKQWLDACIKAGKYLTKEKALKPKLTVESEMERLGLAVGDKVRVTEEAVKDAFYDARTKRFETLKGVRGEEYIISGGIILEDELFLIMEEFFASGAILATVVTKISGFTLGSYKVTVLSSDKVKIGCTTFDIDTVLGLLEDFMTITTKAGTPDDYIMINGIKVDYKKARELYNFIAN